MVDNHMIGPLPSALFVNHRRLQELLLQGNSWTGTMPTEIGLLGDIKVLSLADHAFTGGIPTELNQLRQLEQINLAGPGKAPPGGAGRLTGALPSLDQAIRLQTVLLSNNALTGHIPNNFLQYCNEELSITVDLHNNLLTGQLPGALTRFDALDIDLTGNQFVGPLPDSICSLDRWMDGAVGRYGCDAILCSAGSYSPTGRQETDRDPCRECRASTVEKDAETKTRLGATTCVWGDVDTGKVSEARILAELYVATAGPTNWEQTWPPLDSFLKERDFEDIDWSLLDNSICEWHGVICNGQGHVEILTLGSNKLVGTIPESLFYLASLVSLDLSYNRVTFDTTHPAGSGTGLEALQHAAQLTRLRMSHTQVRSLRGIGKGSATLTEVFFDGCDFQSPIPRELYDMTKLHTLHLEASFLTGTIAPDIKKLVNLKRLSLNENKLTGSLPKDITELRSLEYLDLSDNDFGGEVPPEFDHLPSGLLSLKINSARGGLGGKLPSFKGLKDVEELELAFNALTGEMPADFLSERRTAGTIKVRLTGNQLTGKLPLGLSVFSSLIIEIEDNMITDIPYALCENQDWMGGEVGLASAEEACTAILCPIGYWSPHGRAVFSENVKCTKCEGNSFMGETVCETKGLRRNREVEVLDLLYSATGGRYWNKTHTNWTKPGVPICYREGVFCGYKPADMNSGVTELRLNDYGLRGRIPNEIWELPLLRRLDVSHCPVDLSFDGIEKAPIIQILQLAGTDVSSLKGIENAGEKLKDLYVSDAGLKGSFPTELLRLISLKTMQLDGNKLSGSIPPEIGGLKNLQSVALQDNDLFGPLPREIGTLSLLKNLDVSDNRLSGLLPSELENVAKLESLRLANQRSENKLEGSVLTFSSNPVLHDVDLSGNAFSGTIPATMLSGVDHSAAIKIDLSENELTGSFPVEFRSFQKLEINLAANMIGELSAEVCTNFEWQNGIVGVVPQGKECDAILCPPGTAEIHGRQMHRDSPCQPCSSREEAPFFGSKICLDPFARKEREGELHHKNRW
jgi:Leucine-rich repeat (LRR) protein